MLPTQIPITVRMPRGFLRDGRSWTRVLDAALPRRSRASANWRFQLTPDEVRFVRVLLHKYTRLWVFRTDQQARAGDFLIVDMSCPNPDGRRLWVVDLKLGAKLQVGGGGAGNQLMEVDAATQELVERGLIGGQVQATLLVGDGPLIVRAVVRKTGSRDYTSHPPTG